MKTTAHILAAVAILLIGFGWWGVESGAGRARFDEMAGIIPFGAGIVGLGCLLLAGVLHAIAWKMRRRRGNGPHGT